MIVEKTDMNYLNTTNLRRGTFIKTLAIAAASLLWLVTSSQADTDAPPNEIHKILSCNIRVALPRDDAKGVGWNDRKEICASIIRKQNPDIICLQEVLKVQADDMGRFFPEFHSFGFEGPEMDRYSEGYHGIAKNVILFSKARYQLISEGCYWLSEKPAIGGSISWGSARARQVNWVRLKELNSQKEFRVLNVHLDHISPEAREAQTRFIAEESAQYMDDFPQILVGDFNADASKSPIKFIKEQGWIDTYAAIHGPQEPGFTYHHFIGPEYVTRNGKIDWIFCRGGVQPVSAGIIKDQRNGHYPSDHYFLSAEFVLEPR